ncbi:hypothetical protein B296_00027615 [Ensete ventricosum]|uniref:STAS domain-containing protein n=1 Tax=Ensete ventricosum TaxID=4639 RepID=A0A427A7Y1_ENSVE|nr:hypothetical protein B296_00027615 [Ensete ventricosum]
MVTVENSDAAFPAGTVEGVEFARRVPLPPPRPFLDTLRANLKETLFPDDPFRQFKNETGPRRFLVGLKYFFPVFQWAPSYNLSLLRSDLVAGITIASLAIPQGISYAKLANLPPVLGLCAFELCAADGVRSDGELEGSRSGDCGGAIAVDCVDVGKGRAAVAEPDTVRALGLHRDVLCWGLSSVLGAVKIILNSIWVVILKIGYLKKGLNPPSLSDLVLSAPHMMVALKTGIVTGIIALAEGIAVGRSFAMFKNYHIDGNKEMIAFGTMNIAGSLTSCYLTTGVFLCMHSSSLASYYCFRSCDPNALYDRAVLEVGGELQRRLQDGGLQRGDGGGGDAHFAVLDALVPLHSSGGALRHHHICHRRPYRLRCGAAPVACRQDRLLRLHGCILGRRLRQHRDRACHCRTFCVAVSMLRVLLFVARPRTTVLGNIPNSSTYRRMDQYSAAKSVPGVLIIRIDAPIYFANVSYLRER